MKSPPIYEPLKRLIYQAVKLYNDKGLSDRMKKVDEAIQHFSDDIRWQGDLTDERRAILLACCDLYLRFAMIHNDYVDFEIRRVHAMLLYVGRYDEKENVDPG